MPWCPSCETEYRDEFDTCADCGESLVETLPEPQAKWSFQRKPSKFEERLMIEPALLTTAIDDTHAGMLEAMLESYGIPAKRIYLDSGSIVKAYSGNTVFGVELYIPGDCLEEARALLKMDTPPEQEDSPHDYDYSRDYSPDNVGDAEEENDSGTSQSFSAPWASITDLGEKIFGFVNGGNGKGRRIVAWLIVLPMIAGAILYALSMLLYGIISLFQRFLG